MFQQQLGSSSTRLAYHGRLGQPIWSRYLSLVRTLSSSTTTTTTTTTTTWFPPDTEVVVVSTVLPEPHATAAGVRTEWLIRLLASSSGVRRVHYVTSSSSSSSSLSFQSEPLSPTRTTTTTTTSAVDARNQTRFWLEQNFGVNFVYLPPNQGKLTQEWIQSTLKKKINPVLVLFDRFYAEEMYSFHFHQHLGTACDQGVLVLDMQDWHSLRQARQQEVAILQQRQQQQQQPQQLISTSHVFPTLDDDDDDNNNNNNNNNNNVALLRELASIHRCDLTLVCSPFEQQILQQRYHIWPSHKLCCAPLLLSDDKNHHHRHHSNDSWTWAQRKHLVFVGNFKHAPNVDAAKQLQRLWPNIRQHLPTNTQMHIYGAYLDDPNKLLGNAQKGKKQNNNNTMEGFHIHGYCQDLSALLLKSRLLVAPLQFGAGLKGKIVEAWKHALPVVTTTIGSEGLALTSHEFAGVVADNDKDFIQGIVHLYNHESAWNDAQDKRMPLLARLGKDNAETVLQSMANALLHRKERRKQDVQRAILWQTSQQHTTYFSKYIECKRQLRELQHKLTHPNES